MLIRQSHSSCAERPARPQVERRQEANDETAAVCYVGVAVCGTVALAAWGTARCSFCSFAVDHAATAISDGDATSDAIFLSPEADALDAPLATAMASLSEAATSDPDPTEPGFAGVSASTMPQQRSRTEDATSGAISLSPEADALDAPLAPAMASVSEPEHHTRIRQKRRQHQTRTRQNLSSRALPPPRYPSSRPLCWTLAPSGHPKQACSSRPWARRMR